MDSVADGSKEGGAASLNGAFSVDAGAVRAHVDEVVLSDGQAPVGAEAQGRLNAGFPTTQDAAHRATSTSSDSRSRRSTSKQRGAAMSSRLTPP